MNSNPSKPLTTLQQAAALNNKILMRNISPSANILNTKQGIYTSPPPASLFHNYTISQQVTNSPTRKQ
jgi:hypothetical protein